MSFSHNEFLNKLKKDKEEFNSYTKIFNPISKSFNKEASISEQLNFICSFSLNVEKNNFIKKIWSEISVNEQNKINVLNDISKKLENLIIPSFKYINIIIDTLEKEVIVHKNYFKEYKENQNTLTLQEKHRYEMNLEKMNNNILNELIPKYIINKNNLYEDIIKHYMNCFMNYHSSTINQYNKLQIKLNEKMKNKEEYYINSLSNFIDSYN